MDDKKTFLLPENDEIDEMFLTGIGFYFNDIKPNTNFENE